MPSILGRRPSTNSSSGRDLVISRPTLVPDAFSPPTPQRAAFNNTTDHSDIIELSRMPPLSVIHQNPFEHESEEVLDSPMPSPNTPRRAPPVPAEPPATRHQQFDEVDLLPVGGDMSIRRSVDAARQSLYPPARVYEEPEPTPSMFKVELNPPPPHPPRLEMAPVSPSFLRLYTLTSWRKTLLYLVPSILSAIGGAIVPPYMTIIIGDAFSALAVYPTAGATAADKHVLMSAVGSTSIKFAVAGIIGVILGYVKQVMWTRYSECVALRLRTMVFDGVGRKPMEWFDLGMGMSEDEKGASDSVGAGGLMAKFARETDDVRLATGIPTGTALQSLATFLFCLGLALYKQAVLALVTLSMVPLMVLLNVVTQVLVQPMYAVERRAFAEASTEVERTTAAITTVKTFNAQKLEHKRFQGMVNNARDSLWKQSLVWATCIGGTTTILLSMFVIGFWYGAKLVAEHKTTVATIMTVFWATLLAASNLQGVVPQLTYMTKGKLSLASLLTVIQQAPGEDTHKVPVRESFISWKRLSTMSGQSAPTISKGEPQSARPARCRGEFDFRDVCFAYPTRPDARVLRGITLFLPSGETTFIVGGSGSGKSTIAQLLLRLYKPDSGEIVLDTRSLANIPEDCTREHIAAVQQGCILFDMSVHDNVAMGVVGAGRNWMGKYRDLKDVSRDEVIDACKMAFIHDFVMSLPQGYDTMLGTGGSLLSGGQRQRLAIARARIRDPTVLILDEATSALDATSRVVVFEAMRKWRVNRTTIVITHDLSQISADDFVYVMKNGVVIEQGFRFDLMTIPDGVFCNMAAEQAIEPLPVRVENNWQDGSNAMDLLDAEVEENEATRVRAPHLSGYYASFDDFHKRSTVRMTMMPNKHASMGPKERRRTMQVLARPSVLNLGGRSSFQAMNTSTQSLGNADKPRSSFQLPVITRRTSASAETPTRSSLMPSAWRPYSMKPPKRAARESAPAASKYLGATPGATPCATPGASTLSVNQLPTASDSILMKSLPGSTVSLAGMGGPTPLDSSVSLGRVSFAPPPRTVLTNAQRHLSWKPADLGSGPYRNSQNGVQLRRSVQFRQSAQQELDARKSVHPEMRKSTQQVPGIHVSHAISASADYSEDSTVVGTDRKSIVSDTAVHTTTVAAPVEEAPAGRVKGVFQLTWYFFPTIPIKWMFFVGLIGAVGQGVCTPLWSSHISKLITLVGTGDTHAVANSGGLLIVICCANGFATFLQEYCLPCVAASWTCAIRANAFHRVLAQDKEWFDEPRNAPVRLLQSLIKDVDDMRYLVSSILPRMLVVVVMIGMGMIWAMIVGWRLTLVGLAIAPGFAGLMVMSNRIASQAEAKNKVRREAVARTFYESVANIRGIRAMGLESSFTAKFNREAEDTRSCASETVLWTSTAIALVAGMPMFTQALMNYVGAIFIKQGKMTYPTMLEVYTLVLFSLTFAAQMLNFMNLMTKTKVASRDFDRFFSLSLNTVEKRGTSQFPVEGNVVFDRVNFAYPTRPAMEILHDFSLTIRPGESVALVGPSGCGKSTVASLLQKLYEPTAGAVYVGAHTLASADVAWLRTHIAVVAQSANLFDASVADNISYGADERARFVSRADIVRACQDAHIHNFIESLPEGYETNLGENAGLISGGQAQRLQIARALVRHARILILDECTSALDVDNQRAVLDTIANVKETATTVFITHSTEAMRRCDRVVVIDNGRVAEDGPFDALVAKGGVFAQLMKTGEWE